MQLFKTRQGILIRYAERHFLLQEDWDLLVNREELFAYLLSLLQRGQRELPWEEAGEIMQRDLLAPVGSQELWAAGVTYLRSRDARMEESRESGASDCYQKVYEAGRPELFFKALPKRIAAPDEEVYIRHDSEWNVPEPELTLYINSRGQIQGYTIGNDMSSRSIEGENPLYLPQAKIYERSAALGPCLLVPENPLPAETNIRMFIQREGQDIFFSEVRLNRMKRSFPELVAWLFRECAFDQGCYLMTGTGIVPPPDFTLLEGDRISISIDRIGTLVNTVGAWKKSSS